MDTLAHELHSRFGISVSRLLIPGFAEDEIPALVESLKVELLIMGAQGENLRTDRVLGRLATETLSKSNFPVVYVPVKAFLTLSSQLALILDSKQMCNSLGSALLLELSKQLGAQKVLPK